MKLNNTELTFEQFGAAMRKLRDSEHFDYLVTIIGEDFGADEGLGCIYIVENTETHERRSVRTLAKTIDGKPCIESVASLWKCAEMLEREVFDFYGIIFLGNPDMRRLFLRNDFEGFPFRKDFKAKEGYSLDDDKEQDYTVCYTLSDDGHLAETRRKLFKDSDFVVNIGPQHPSTHGVLRLETVLDGETVKKIYPHLGYIHRGIEKMFETMTYPQTLAMTDRLNYLSAMMNRHAICGVIEEALGIELSDRIKTVRTIMDELQRIDGHLLYLGCYAQDLGALTAFLFCMRDREYVLNAMEETTGGRLIQNYYRIGGLQADIDPDFQTNVKKLCQYLKPKLREYEQVFGDNVITHQRLEGVGVLSKADAISYGISGSNGRASDWACDLRKNYPYDRYADVKWEQVVMPESDSQARYYLRIREIEQSIRIIEQLIDNIPEGEYYIKQKPIIKCPEGQWYYAVEGTSGEFGVYLHSKGDKTPYRMKLRPMALTLVAALDEMLQGTKVADLIAVGAGLDYIIPDIDR